MYKKILLAYDGSQSGQHALLDCRDIAQWSQATLSLVAVTPLSVQMVSMEGGFYDPLLADIDRKKYAAILADGLQQSGMPKPAILEGFNVEKTTAAVLGSGGTGQGTLLGNMLDDTAKALGGTVTRWEPLEDGNIWHLRVHISYP